MKTAIVFISPNGTTKLLTDGIAEIFRDLGTVTVFDIERCGKDEAHCRAQ